MKYNIESGRHVGPKWDCISFQEFDTKKEALAQLNEESARIIANPGIIEVEHIKMVDTGEDNPNKNPRVYHYITSFMPGVWCGTS